MRGLRNFVGPPKFRRSSIKQTSANIATFAHTPDLSNISYKAAFADTLARFLRLKLWDVVCYFNELHVASKHWKPSALAVVICIGFPPVSDASEADKQGGIRCQRKAAAVR
jgi:hypothetical protein